MARSSNRETGKSSGRSIGPNSAILRLGRWQLGLRHLLCLVLICAMLAWLVVLLQSPVPVVGLIVLLTIIGGEILLIFRTQSGDQEAFLSMLSNATARELPLAPALEAIASQFRGRFPANIRAIADDLNHGASLVDVLSHYPGVLPLDTEVLVRVGTQTGQLAKVIAETNSDRHQFNAARSRVIGRIIYLLSILVNVQVVSAFLFYFILPKFRAILSDFGVPFPELTQTVISIEEFLGHNFLFVLLLFAAELCLIAVLVLSPTTNGSYLVERVLFGPVTSRRHASLVLQSLSWLVEGGHSLTTAIGQLATWYPSRSMRQRLGYVLVDLNHGTDWVDSFVHHGLLKSGDAVFMRSATRVGNLSWVLRETARRYERRFLLRFEAFSHGFSIFVLISTGILIGLTCLAYFLPLVRIMELLTS